MSALQSTTTRAAALRRRTRSPTPESLTSSPSLGDLPEDELLLVLSLLTPKELLRCRAVCRRWRDLALHPTLWHRAHLRYSSSGSERNALFLEAALQLAPCAASLRLVAEREIDKIFPHLVETSCAVAALRIVSSAKKADQPLAMVIKRQASLGRLQRLRIKLEDQAVEDPGVHYLLQILDSLEGLVEMDVKFDADFMGKAPRLPALDGPPAQASLQKLRLRTSALEPHLSISLSRHFCTLRSVTVHADASELASRLAALPNLCELCCPALKNMDALVACASLRSLRLLVDLDTSKPSLTEAAAFLRASTGLLTAVTFRFPFDEDDEQVVNLVLALGGSRGPTKSVLERLTLDFEEEDTFSFDCIPQPQLRLLTSILHRLPRLQYLDIGGATSDDFLNAIDTTTLPDLCVLGVGTGGHGQNCSHGWMHNAGVRAVLARCPTLHVDIKWAFCYDYNTMSDEEDVCQYCEDWKSCSCYKQFKELPRDIRIYTHRDVRKCAVCELPCSRKHYSVTRIGLHSV